MSEFSPPPQGSKPNLDMQPPDLVEKTGDAVKALEDIYAERLGLANGSIRVVRSDGSAENDWSVHDVYDTKDRNTGETKTLVAVSKPKFDDEGSRVINDEGEPDFDIRIYEPDQLKALQNVESGESLPINDEEVVEDIGEAAIKDEVEIDDVGGGEEERSTDENTINETVVDDELIGEDSNETSGHMDEYYDVIEHGITALKSDFAPLAEALTGLPREFDASFANFKNAMESGFSEVSSSIQNLKRISVDLEDSLGFVNRLHFDEFQPVDSFDKQGIERILETVMATSRVVNTLQEAVEQFRRSGSSSQESFEEEFSRKINSQISSLEEISLSRVGSLRGSIERAIGAMNERVMGGQEAGDAEGESEAGTVDVSDKDYLENVDSAVGNVTGSLGILMGDAETTRSTLRRGLSIDDNDVARDLLLETRVQAPLIDELTTNLRSIIYAFDNAQHFRGNKGQLYVEIGPGISRLRRFIEDIQHFRQPDFEYTEAFDRMKHARRTVEEFANSVERTDNAINTAARSASRDS